MKKASYKRFITFYVVATIFLLLVEMGLYVFYQHPRRLPLSVTVNYESIDQNKISFYGSLDDWGYEEHVFESDVKNNKATFYPDYGYTYFCIKASDNPGTTQIKNITFKVVGIPVFTVNSQNFLQYVLRTDNAQIDITDSKTILLSTNADNGLVFFNPVMSEGYFTKALGAVFFTFVAVALLLLILPTVSFVVLRGLNPKDSKKNILLIVIQVVSFIVGCLAGFLSCATYFIQNNFYDVPIGQILYHINTPLEGAGTTSFAGPITALIVILILVTLMTLVLPLIFARKAKKQFVVFSVMQIVASLLILSSSTYILFTHFDLIDYWKYTHENTTIYETYFASPDDLELTFPTQKRNLIYIYLESMEMSFADIDNGGNMTDNYIPELSSLALNNICFNGDSNSLNGAYPVNGATFTMGALVAQTGGAPINETQVDNKTLNGYWESDNNYLPGLINIGDILASEGYNQEFLIGSDGNFAGRSSYFRGHGDYTIFDYYTAIEREYIPEDYYVWWGIEDFRIFDYAKEEITNLANQDEPFNFTMLTVDTHFTNGWYCDFCEPTYPLQYANVLACSSRQVEAFVEWIMAQPFYENTTIVISGDHLTSDAEFIDATYTNDFDRRSYVAIINPSPECNVANNNFRVYTTLDMFPTTLASLGVDIPGDRLGLGVNLFSNTPTLAEELGYETLNTELLKNSTYYTNNLLYGH